MCSHMTLTLSWGFLILSRSVSSHGAEVPPPPEDVWTVGGWPSRYYTSEIYCLHHSLSHQVSIYSSSALYPGVTLDRLLGSLLCASLKSLPFLLRAGHALVSSVPSVSPRDPPLPFSPLHTFVIVPGEKVGGRLGPGKQGSM